MPWYVLSWIDGGKGCYTKAAWKSAPTQQKLWMRPAKTGGIWPWECPTNVVRFCCYWDAIGYVLGIQGSKLGSPKLLRGDDLDYNSERKQGPLFTTDLDQHWLGSVFLFSLLLTRCWLIPSCGELNQDLDMIVSYCNAGYVLYLLVTSVFGCFFLNMFMFYTHAWQIGMQTPNWPTFVWG